MNSAFYNSFQKGPAQGRWNSAEDLYKIGASYKYFISVEYNTVNPTPGKGSAIFMHIWKGPDSSTAGCTAMSEENLVKIICWLEPSKKPMLLQYPMQDLAIVIDKCKLVITYYSDLPAVMCFNNKVY